MLAYYFTKSNAQLLLVLDLHMFLLDPSMVSQWNLRPYILSENIGKSKKKKKEKKEPTRSNVSSAALVHSKTLLTVLPLLLSCT